jgi:predicted nucleic acid-binding protein
VIHLDTSVLVDALTGPRRSAGALRALIARGERTALSTLVLYEWRRGPRIQAELDAQEALLPSDEAVPFDPAAALRAAGLFAAMKRPKSRELDLAIAACALVRGASIWTLNRDDFSDVPGLELYDPRTSDGSESNA